MQAEDVIKLLDLKPLPGEGGYFRRTYTAGIQSPHVHDRAMASAIYYLITDRSWSAIHRLPSDEMYHFYLGDPLDMILLYPDGNTDQIILGSNLSRGEIPQFHVPPNVWQGTKLVGSGKFALVGTTVSPAYMDDDLELADISKLKEQYQDYAAAIDYYAQDHQSM